MSVQAARRGAVTSSRRRSSGGSGPTPSAFLYVAKTGSDANPGTLASPKLTIQAAINAGGPGTEINIRTGTYNEALSLPGSGTALAPCWVKNYSGETVTVSSGTSYAVRTNGNKSYWIFDGLRFQSTFVSGRYPEGSINFSDSDSGTGNNFNIIRNCYIAGGIQVYGHHNLIENNEIDGGNTWENGFRDLFSTSHHNIIRGNDVHGHSERGIWSMSQTDSVLIENNTVHHVGYGTLGTAQNYGMPIDIDGASVAPTNSVVRGNYVYDSFRGGILLEDGINGLVENNVVANCPNQAIDCTDYAKHQFTASNITIRNNVVYNSLHGIHLDIGGSYIYNNTLINSGDAGIRVSKVNWLGNSYCAANNDIANNIISGSNGIRWTDASCSPGGNGITMRNNVYYNVPSWTHTWGGSNRSLSAVQGLGFESGSISSNPLFVNAASNDYHLQSGSPARGAGLSLAAVPTDKDGLARANPPSIGAYE